jgi:hypothetical protein
LRFGFRDNREDLDLGFCNVIKHPDVINAQPILRLAETAEALDAALAHLRRLMQKVPLDGRFDSGADWRRKSFQRAGRFRGHDDLVGREYNAGVGANGRRLVTRHVWIG